MMEFMDENFILQNETAQKLYNGHAKKMPIIDYHCHLSPKDIAENRQFENLTQIWLEGDHYKWRAMRANGIDEEFITGKADDFEKFQKWAETVPYTMRNPLYHWTHMELLRPFGIKKILNPDTAKEIYDEATAMLLTPQYSVQGILKKMKVDLTYFNLRVEGDLREEHPKKFEAMKVIYEFRGNNLELEKLEKAVNLSVDKYCGVNANYKDAMKMSYEVKILS